MNRGNKKGFGYLGQVSVDTKNGIITGVDVFPANRRESDIILTHLKKQIDFTGLKISRIALDKGYDVGAVHRGLEILGITGYCSAVSFHNTPQDHGFKYDKDSDSFICPAGKFLRFNRIVLKKATQNYARIYEINRKTCTSCENCNNCLIDSGGKKIFTSAFYPSLFASHERNKTPEYYVMKRLRSIWSEGTFAVLKREHNLGKAQKRGIERMKEQCLLAALSLNLKRMVMAICPYFSILSFSTQIA